MMYYLNQAQMIIKVDATRLNKVDTPKDDSYHVSMAKHYGEIRGVSDYRHRIQELKSSINWNFYKGNQWIFDEDLDPFLMDESGQARNRIRWVQNIIKPIVRHYTGTAIKLSFDAKVKSISREAIVRKMTEKNIMHEVTALSQEFPQAKDSLKNRYPIGDTIEETDQIFETTYVDKFERGVNRLIKAVENKTKIHQKKSKLASHIAIDGIAVLYEKYGNNRVSHSIIDPRYFFFDRSAQELDLHDAEFMGHTDMMLITELYEEFDHLDSNTKILLEQHAKNVQTSNIKSLFGGSKTDGNRVPVRRVYWRDTQKEEYAFVEDDLGEVSFRQINSDNSPYTDKDIIIPDDEDSKDLLNKGDRAVVYPDHIRYCYYLPQELLSVTGNRAGDILLASGIYMDSNEYSWDDKDQIFPYKVHTWDYHDGEVIAPVDDLISPQRYINRLLSISESHINNSRMSGTILDRSLLDEDEDDEQEVMRKINTGQPIFVDGKRQLNNQVGEYKTNLDNKLLQLYEVANLVKNAAGDSVGFNAELSGQAQGYRSSSTIAMNNLNQGSIMQEPVFNALSSIFIQVYESLASRGLAYFMKNRRKLRTMMGDEIAEMFFHNPSFASERYHLSVVRTESDVVERDTANSLLLQFLQLRLIDDDMFAKMFNNATISDVGAALREAAALRRLAASRQAKAQQQQGAAAIEADQAAGQLDDVQQSEDQLMRMLEVQQRNAGRQQPQEISRR